MKSSTLLGLYFFLGFWTQIFQGLVVCTICPCIWLEFSNHQPLFLSRTINPIVIFIACQVASPRTSQLQSQNFQEYHRNVQVFQRPQWKFQISRTFPGILGEVQANTYLPLKATPRRRWSLIMLHLFSQCSPSNEIIAKVSSTRILGAFKTNTSLVKFSWQTHLILFCIKIHVASNHMTQSVTPPYLKHYPRERNHAF